MFPNFKRNVPENIQKKIYDLVQSFDFHEQCNTFKERFCCENFRRIMGNHQDGWMPNQDGGFEKNELYQSDMDSTYHFTQKQTDRMQDSYAYCVASFCRENNVDSIYDENDNLRDDFCEYESDWFQPALLQFQVFINGDSVIARLAVNYQDAPYYRDKYAENIISLCYGVDKFMSMPNGEILKSFTF